MKNVGCFHLPLCECHIGQVMCLIPHLKLKFLELSEPLLIQTTFRDQVKILYQERLLREPS